jgi:integrase
VKGHLKERSPGHWAIILDVRDPQTGRRKRKWHSFKGTKREAHKECARLVHQMSVGTYIVPSKATLAAYLEVWLADIKSRITPKTYLRYSELARKNIVPLLGETLLKDLQPAAISHAYASLLESGHRKGGGLSAGTVRHVHRLLKQALAQAVRWGGDWAISRNPCDAVRPPKAAPAKMSFVCAREDGLPLQPQTFTHEWKRLVAKIGLPRIRFHDLRHAHATHLLASGVHPKIASERLGHSKVGITLDLYSHVLPGMQEEAVAKVDAAMQAARNKRETKG